MAVVWSNHKAVLVLSITCFVCMCVWGHTTVSFFIESGHDFLPFLLNPIMEICFKSKTISVTVYVLFLQPFILCDFALSWLDAMKLCWKAITERARNLTRLHMTHTQQREWERGRERERATNKLTGVFSEPGSAEFGAKSSVNSSPGP